MTMKKTQYMKKPLWYVVVTGVLRQYGSAWAVSVLDKTTAAGLLCVAVKLHQLSTQKAATVLETMCQLAVPLQAKKAAVYILIETLDASAIVMVGVIVVIVDASDHIKSLMLQGGQDVAAVVTLRPHGQVPRQKCYVCQSRSSAKPRGPVELVRRKAVVYS